MFKRLAARNRRRVRGSIQLGDLQRLEPVSRLFGFDRGQPIDRFYIEKFLAGNSVLIQGRVLEVGDDDYSRKFGGSNVSRQDILHLTNDNPRATIIADLTRADSVPPETFDCIVCTQTLQFIYDLDKAVGTLYRILKSGGALLATFSGISQISRYDMDRWGEYWRVTSLSARLLFEKIFGAGKVTVETYGNVLTATCFLQGLAAEELLPEELEYRDPDYEVLIAIKAVK